MSTKYDDRLYMAPFASVELSVPELPLKVLPGRAAVLSHPVNAGSEVLTVDSEMYHPDVCLVAQSGIGFVEPGQVWIVAPDRGAYYPGLSPDGREVRLVCANQSAVAVRGNSGLNVPWEVFIAQYGEGDRLAPGPGWWLIELHEEEGRIVTPDRCDKGNGLCTVLAGTAAEREGERWATKDMAGTQTYSAGLVGYRLYGKGWAHNWRLVRNPCAPKAWLRSVSAPRRKERAA